MISTFLRNIGKKAIIEIIKIRGWNDEDMPGKCY